VADLIRKAEVHTLKELMRKSTEVGMQTFDQALYILYEAGEVTYEDAIAHADAPNDLRLMIKLGSNTNDIAPDLSLQENEDEKDKRGGVIRRR
jgi:twitching motility protein PilU